MQLAIQAAIDVALHVAAEDFAKTPQDYGSSFVILAEGGILNARLADNLVKGTKLRNILVHAYLDIDEEKMWQNLEGLADLEILLRPWLDIFRPKIAGGPGKSLPVLRGSHGSHAICMYHLGALLEAPKELVDRLRARNKGELAERSGDTEEGSRSG